MTKEKKYRRRNDVLKWLQDQNLSQADWARLLDVPNMTVFYWIHRNAKPHQIYLERIKDRTPGCPFLQELKGVKENEKWPTKKVAKIQRV